VHANYPNPNGAFSYGKPNSTLPENAIANILTKSGSLLQDSPRDRASVGYLFGLFTRALSLQFRSHRAWYPIALQGARSLLYSKRSIWLDIYILPQTVIVVLNGRGAK
jgi:hypothetical protein